MESDCLLLCAKHRAEPFTRILSFNPRHRLCGWYYHYNIVSGESEVQTRVETGRGPGSPQEAEQGRGGLPWGAGERGRHVFPGPTHASLSSIQGQRGERA